MTDNSTIKEYEIRSYELNANIELKPFVLLHYFEDVAYENAERLGFGFSATYPNGYAWFLIKYHMTFDKLPSWENVKIKTWASENKGIQCRREFEVYNKDNEKIGSVSSLWVLIDMNTKKIVNSKKVLNFPPLSGEFALDTRFEKIPVIERIDNEIILTASFEDIDMNKHVNNSNYIIWATKALDNEFLMNNSMKEIEIYYKHEIKCGDSISSKVQYDSENNVSLHSFTEISQNVEAAQIRIHWQKRN